MLLEVFHVLGPSKTTRKTVIKLRHFSNQPNFFELNLHPKDGFKSKNEDYIGERESSELSETISRIRETRILRVLNRV